MSPSMLPGHDMNDMSATQRELSTLFELAAAKNISESDIIAAEPEMARFLRAVEDHPDERAFVATLMFDALSRYRKCPWNLVQYCMYRLRWPEVLAFVRKVKHEDV